MSSRHPLPEGFVLVEVLLALAVLGTGLLGAGTALVRNLQATREVLLVLRGADLTADLGEAWAVRGTTGDSAATLAGWRSRLAAELPAGSSAVLAQARVVGAAAAPLLLVSARLSLPAGGTAAALELLVPDPAPDDAP